MLIDKKCDMQMLQHYVDSICEELESALSYAEFYIIFKNSKPAWSKMYKDMASTELVHADYLRTMAQEFADGLSWLSERDTDCWMCVLSKQAEVENQVKIMLSK